MKKEQFLAIVLSICDWSQSGDDEAVLKPLIDLLAEKSDDEIFAFDDMMAELLYDLDTRELMPAA